MNDKARTFWVRTASAAVYAGLFIGSIYSGTLLHHTNIGVAILTGFLFLVSLGCTYEFYRMVKKQGGRPNEVYGVLSMSCMMLTLCMMSLQGYAFIRVASLGILLAMVPVLLIGSIVLQLWGKSKRPFADASYTMVPMFYIGLPMGLMPMMHTSYNVLMMLILIVWANDCMAYIGGTLIGKHKLWQRHSPGKTWEGCLVGLAFSIAIAMWLGPMFNSKIAWHGWLTIGLIGSVVGTLGDLVESMLKRSVGVKDSGNIMPGHGGFLDRFDSLLTLTPVVFAYIFIILNI